MKTIFFGSLIYWGLIIPYKISNYFILDILLVICLAFITNYSLAPYFKNTGK